MGICDRRNVLRVQVRRLAPTAANPGGVLCRVCAGDAPFPPSPPSVCRAPLAPPYCDCCRSASAWPLWTCPSCRCSPRSPTPRPWAPTAPPWPWPTSAPAWASCSVTRASTPRLPRPAPPRPVERGASAAVKCFPLGTARSQLKSDSNVGFGWNRESTSGGAHRTWTGRRQALAAWPARYV